MLYLSRYVDALRIDENWDKTMCAFVKAIRERNRAAYHNFDVVLSKAALVVPWTSAGVKLPPALSEVI